jgi:hypothetical protein
MLLMLMTRHTGPVPRLWAANKGDTKMKTMIAVMVAAASLLGSTFAMARPYHVDSGWGPPTGTMQDRAEQLNAGASNGF